MSSFDYLLLAHFIGDFPLQTNWMAVHKANKWLPLLTHALVYTLTVSMIAWFGFGGLSIWGILLVFVAHVVLDRRIFVQWWLRTVMGTTGKEAIWLGIIVDQVFHLVVLFIAVALRLS